MPERDTPADGPAAPAAPARLAVEARALTRRFGEVVALDRVSLAIGRGEFFSLLGPSGCGKTTLLRLIAGLDLPDEGMLRIGGQDAAGIPAHRRQVNTVFQSYALFPHLTVRDNVAFGLRMKKVPAAQIAGRVAGVMALVEIADLAARRPAQLSGGQKPRVALARALVNEPEVLLLDEPLGALDLKLRRQLQTELRALQRRTGITFLHVTHDQDEALGMSDRIAVMNAGRIEQLDAAPRLYERPRTRFVARFLGACNLIEGRVRGSGRDTLEVDSPFGGLRVTPGPETRPVPPDGPVTLAIRPEKIALHKGRTTVGAGEVRAQITELAYRGAETVYRLVANGQRFEACALNARLDHQGFAAGETVVASLPAEALVVLED